ncbi:MAG: ribonuclease III [Clostridiales bacterium]|nr:ribonuclease III [Clostridiales bacterium]
MNFPFTEIENKIGYTFRDKALLEEAFTHSTYAHIHGGKDNERMEYLGDAVLQLVVTEWQYLRDARAEEGRLTFQRQKYVCEDALDEAVRSLGLQKYLRIEGGRANVGKKTISSIFETVVAAIYLDGGYAPAKAFILQHGRLETQAQTENHKGALQEWLQSQGERPPVYQTVKSGKDNAPVFEATVTAMGQNAFGSGGNKKEAEQQAAKMLLDKLGNITRTPI